MAKNNEVYIDTSAFISFLDKSDTYHPLFARLFSESKINLITSPLVISEGHGWFLKRFDSKKALQFISFIESLSILTILDIYKKELNSSFLLLRKFLDQNLTLTDALGLYLMKKRKIEICWSTDRHLTITGIPLIIHKI